ACAKVGPRTRCPMMGSGKTLGALLSGVVTATAVAAPPGSIPATGSPMPAMPAPMPALPNTAGAVRVNLSDVVFPDYRDAVLKVVKQPTLSTRASAPEVICTVAMYEWLFEHPDRVALAWQ